MAMFVAKRILFTAIVLLGAVTIVFFLSNFIPADPVVAALGDFASKEAVEKYRHELGLDLPVYVQYWRYLQQLLRGNFGTSITSRQPVVSDLVRMLPATLELLLPSLLLAGLAGVVLGVISAVQAGRWSDHLSRVLSLFGMSMPVFWLGLGLQILFFRWLGVLPIAGRLPTGVSAPPEITGLFVLDALLAGNLGLAGLAAKHLVLPIITLSLVDLALMARLTRGILLDVLRTDYVRTARSKGLSERVVVYRHALRNAMLPLVTVYGLRIGSALGGAVITETVYAWPGIGRLAVQAITRFDYPIITGFTLMMCFAYALVNLLVDISYLFLDPRVKYG